MASATTAIIFRVKARSVSQKMAAFLFLGPALALLALFTLASARVHLLDPKNYEFKVSHCAEHCFIFVVDSSQTEVLSDMLSQSTATPQRPSVIVFFTCTVGQG